MAYTTNKKYIYIQHFVACRRAVSLCAPAKFIVIDLAQYSSTRRFQGTQTQLWHSRLFCDPS